MTQWQIPKETKKLILQIFADIGNKFGEGEEPWETPIPYNKKKDILWVSKNIISIQIWLDPRITSRLVEVVIQEEDTIDDIMQICEFMQMRYLKYLERKGKENDNP